MANLWCHYLSKLAALHSLLLFIWPSRLTGICSLLEKESKLAVDVLETPSAKG